MALILVTVGLLLYWEQIGDKYSAQLGTQEIRHAFSSCNNGSWLPNPEARAVTI